MRLLHRHLPTDLAGDLLPPAEQAPRPARRAPRRRRGTGASAGRGGRPTGRRLGASKTSSTCCSSMKWLLGPIVPNRMPRQLLRHPRQLTHDAVGAAVAVHVETAVLLDPLELLGVEPEPVDREAPPLPSRIGSTSSVGQLEASSRRPRVPLANPPVEVAMASAPGRSMSSAINAMPQFTELPVNVERIVPRVATVMLDGISMSPLWRKSGSTTGGATRSASRTPSRRSASTRDPRVSRCSRTRGGSTIPSAARHRRWARASFICDQGLRPTGRGSRSRSGGITLRPRRVGREAPPVASARCVEMRPAHRAGDAVIVRHRRSRVDRAEACARGQRCGEGPVAPQLAGHVRPRRERGRGPDRADRIDRSWRAHAATARRNRESTRPAIVERPSRRP